MTISQRCHARIVGGVLRKHAELRRQVKKLEESLTCLKATTLDLGDALVNERERNERLWAALVQQAHLLDYYTWQAGKQPQVN